MATSILLHAPGTTDTMHDIHRPERKDYKTNAVGGIYKKYLSTTQKRRRVILLLCLFMEYFAHPRCPCAHPTDINLPGCLFHALTGSFLFFFSFSFFVVPQFI
jgi:hypothetical protein